MPQKYPLSIILASSSPRRKELLAEAGYEFTVFPPHIDESVFSTEDVKPDEYAERLALAKARNVAERFANCLVIGADTVVDLNGQVIGKAADVKEAEMIIRKLFSTTHKVITGVAIVRVSDDTELVESETTTVYPKKLTDEQIAEHIKSQSWRGKSGAYAIRENGDEFVEKIEGSLTNVMGLPMELVNKMLRKIAA